MNARADADLKSSTALQPLTKKQKLNIAVAALQALPKLKTLNTIPDIEGKTVGQLAQIPTAGTVFDPVVAALAAHGSPIEANVGAVQEALGLSHEDVHYIACECHEHADQMHADTAATRMEEIADLLP